MSFQPNEVDNPFPRPPERFKLFTDRNVSLLKTLRERSGTQLHDPLPEGQAQDDILEGENLEGVAEDLIELEPPRVDWVVEGGRFAVFEQWYDIVDGHPRVNDREITNTIVQMPEGGEQVSEYPIDHSNLRLKRIFHRLRYPPPFKKAPQNDPAQLLYPSGRHYPKPPTSFMLEISRAFLSAVNSVRPLQARQTLEQLLIRQLETRKEETRKIHEKCDSIEATLAALKAKAAEIQQQQEVGLEKLSLDDTIPNVGTNGGTGVVTDDEVLQWANEV
ncbi:Mediator of RNA polymerase II transcription subunit 7, partial [Tulasnella sp. 417]